MKRLQISFFVSIISLVGCITPPLNNTLSSNLPSQNQTVARFTLSEQARVRSVHESKSWALFGTGISQTDQVQSMYFVNPATIARFGSVARLRQLVVRAAPSQSTKHMARIDTLQIDCNARTSQLLSVEPFSDVEATVVMPVVRINSKAEPILVNTIADNLMVGACTGQFRLAPSTVARNTSGSAVVIAPGLVLTNQHVVNNCPNLDVLLAGKRYPASIKKQDSTNDLALLSIANLPLTNVPRLRKTAVTGESVMVAGYPLSGLLSSDIIVTDGIVNSLSGLGNNAGQIQISAPVQPGNSGGPLLDRSGNLVGLVVSKLNAQRLAALTGDIAQNINFAIKPEIVGLFLQSENVVMNAPEQRIKFDTQQLAEYARAFTMKVECRAKI